MPTTRRYDHRTLAGTDKCHGRHPSDEAPHELLHPKPYTLNLVAEWIHFTLFGIILATIILKVYTFWGLMNSATKYTLKPQTQNLEFRPQNRNISRLNLLHKPPKRSLSP